MNTLVLAPFTDAGLAALRQHGAVAYEPWTQTQRLYDPRDLGARLILPLGEGPYPGGVR